MDGQRAVRSDSLFREHLHASKKVLQAGALELVPLLGRVGRLVTRIRRCRSASRGSVSGDLWQKLDLLRPDRIDEADDALVLVGGVTGPVVSCSKHAISDLRSS